MAIISNPRGVVVIKDPLTATSNITVVSGNAVQYFNAETQEYTPDRGAVPLILLPSVSVVDPTGQMTGIPAITGVEWYIGVPLKDGSNRITTTTEGFEIGDGTVTGFPKFALKVKKNIGINSPVEIYGTAIFTDVRTSEAVRVTNSIKLYTTYQDGQNFSLKITDQPAGLIINPLDIVPDANGRWPVTISMQLFSGTKAVADANAAYWWKIQNDDKTWREFTQDELDLMVISGRNTDGTWSKSITLDARMFKSVSIQAQAAYYQGTRPAAPQSAELTQIVSFKIQMPARLSVDIFQTAGAKMAGNLSTPVTYTANIHDNVKSYGSDKDKLFDFTFMAKSAKPGSTEVVAGKGSRTVTFIPASLGFDPKYQVSVYLKLGLYKVYAIVTNGGKNVISGGKAVIVPTYE